MKIITLCPLCKDDFMYDPSADHHLIRSLVSKSGDDEVENIVAICQDCDEVENIAEYIKEKAEHRGWENAEYMAEDKFGTKKTNLAMAHLNKYSHPH